MSSSLCCGAFRVVGKTDMNAQSSRSHCGFMIYIRAERTVVRYDDGRALNATHAKQVTGMSPRLLTVWNTAWRV